MEKDNMNWAALATPEGCECKKSSNAPVDTIKKLLKIFVIKFLMLERIEK